MRAKKKNRNRIRNSTSADKQKLLLEFNGKSGTKWVKLNYLKVEMLLISTEGTFKIHYICVTNTASDREQKISYYVYKEQNYIINVFHCLHFHLFFAVTCNIDVHVCILVRMKNSIPSKIPTPKAQNNPKSAYCSIWGEINQAGLINYLLNANVIISPPSR